jgi:hypothetical protein
MHGKIKEYIRGFDGKVRRKEDTREAETYVGG